MASNCPTALWVTEPKSDSINLAASLPEEWAYGQPRKIEPFSTLEVDLLLKRWAPPSKREFYDVMNSDLFGLIRRNFPI